MIQEIEISLAYGITTIEKSKKFNLSTYCVTDFFLRLLDKFAIGKIKKIVIECSETEILKQSNPADDSMNVVVLRRHVNIGEYFRMSIKEKKQWSLEILVDAFKELNKHYDFSFQKIQSVSKEIRESDYKNHYHHGKMVTSPGKKLKAQLWAEHEIEKFNLFVDISTPDEALRDRQPVASTLPNWVAYLPVLGSIKWENDKSISVIGKNKKVIKKVKVK